MMQIGDFIFNIWEGCCLRFGKIKSLRKCVNSKKTYAEVQWYADDAYDADIAWQNQLSSKPVFPKKEYLVTELRKLDPQRLVQILEKHCSSD